MNPRKAFTLIELLVVIAIIAILAAILFPVFAQAKASAKAVTCLSNTKQMTLGVIQYTTDNDDICPLTEWMDPVAGTWSGASVTTPTSVFGYTERRNDYWSNSVLPYIKNLQIYNCPSAWKSRSDVFGVTIDQAFGYTYSLTFNGYLNQWPMTTTNMPASTFFFSEGLGIGTMPRYANDFPLLISPSGWEGMFIADDKGVHCAEPYVYGFNVDVSWWVHAQGTNYSFLDGHAKHIRNPAGTSAWATTDLTGIPQYLWADGTACGDGCCWFYWYGPTNGG